MRAAVLGLLATGPQASPSPSPALESTAGVPVDPAPVAASGRLAGRLDALQTNVQQRVSRPVRAVDERFARDAQQRVVVPDSRLRVGLYTEFVGGHDTQLTFKPDVDLDVKLPNLENRLHLFVQGGQADDLPGRSLGESANQVLTLGVRKFLEDCDLSADAGVRASWPPRAYARVTWHPELDYGQWAIRPQQRVFADTRDRLGSLSALSVDRWVGAEREYYVGSLSSAKYTQEREAYSWGQTLRVGHVRALIEDRPRIGRYDRRRIASGGDVAATAFGTDSSVDTYRVTVGRRRPLYRNWIFWEIEPGLEWTRDNDFDTAFRLMMGVDALFWETSGH